MAELRLDPDALYVAIDRLSTEDLARATEQARSPESAA